ncbi:Cell division protein FtsI [Pediococcus damnosus]|uniref:Cell division protein FtsI n=1 Tax=Pediococcus damnosus TaxID=51663 RepID=A0A0R2HKZ5_9LACO|nr:penicillin-binding transpeptidase domain-containing protein [Pediococcus damnosus]AMV61855.1 Cell division protein FtsI [Pediococcus damnosus]AMV66270.1 Cell division protein FtsI [Pediococcus damnosus]KJU74000.1 penicillin-binding protein [Pediococcus damnosus LMG 28219]KRN53619.1 penicillin binding protein 2B [Pediococcus damnosus]PIO80317.1 penicillin-binding protein [Pediococcus damnosus]
MNNKEKRLKKNNHNKSSQNRRSFGQWLFFIAIALFVILILRFSYIAIGGTVEHINLSSQARRLYTDNKVLKAQRGSILDASGQPIAEDTSTYSVYAVLNKNQVGANKKPLYVTDKKKTAKVLAKYLPISEKKALAALNPTNENTFQVEFGTAGKNISVATKEKIESYKLTGINFIQSEARLYPNGTFASNLIGITSQATKKDSDITQLKGVMGIESAFNNKLTGTDGQRSIQKDKFGYQLPSSQEEKSAVNGQNIYTTLDTRLQTLLESEMTKVQDQVHAKSMTATLMNAKTGAILATSQRPTFNPTTKSGINKAWSNSLVQDTFEPGSTMKVFTAAAAIDSGHFNAKEKYKSGTYTIGNQVVPDWQTSGWGLITYEEGFARSSNVSMAHLERKMGAKTWKKYINRFNFLKSTDSGLAGEASGSMQFTYPIDQADTAFGQGIDVTDMQMLQGFTAIANNGKMVKPQYIKKVVDTDTGKVTDEMKTENLGKPVKSSTAKKVRKLMEDVVYKSYGIGQDFKIPGYKVAAKTGTAQVVGSGGTYLNGNDSYLYSVVGMVPASNPKYIMYITMKQPTLPATKTATQLLNEIFSPVMKQALGENNSTAKNQVSGKVKIANMVGEASDTAVKDLGKQNIAATVMGTGSTVTQQSPVTGTEMLAGQRVILLTSGQMKMPNLSGWSRNDVLKLTDLVGLEAKFSGTGFVKSQSIKSGTIVQNGQTLTVKLKQK